MFRVYQVKKVSHMSVMCDLMKEEIKRKSSKTKYELKPMRQYYKFCDFFTINPSGIIINTFYKLELYTKSSINQ